MAGTHVAATMHMCSSQAVSHSPRRVQQQKHAPSRPSRQRQLFTRAALPVGAKPSLPERGGDNASASGCADAGGRSQLQLLRSCGTGLAAVAAMSVLLHSGAASAADPSDLSQHHHAANAVFDLAAGGEEDFWGNVDAYIRFFVTVMLGTVNVVSQPFRKAAKRPATAVALVVGGVVLFAFMAVTVKTMLGVGDSDFEYLTRGI